ncbi:2-oxoglutarate and iron-dependent oxygenase domain-containing protein [Halopseudomonas pachastrellae]|nr:2-oxoglutarate and iron-dependent oxygenase domain-containing protein [Halopseudomonas pachastrellae]
MQSLPLISVAGLNSEDPAVRAETARQLGVACREIGFFYAVDHGIPAEVRPARLPTPSACSNCRWKPSRTCRSRSRRTTAATSPWPMKSSTRKRAPT